MKKELFFGLRPPMCGKAMLFRRCSNLFCGFAAILRSIKVCSRGKKVYADEIWRRSRKDGAICPEKHSFSAHQAAEPQRRNLYFKE